MAGIRQRIEDYDDYYDFCQELQITPYGMMDNDFYQHWEFLERLKHREDEGRRFSFDGETSREDN